MQPVISFRVAKSFAETEVALRAALQAEGFGVLTEVDMQATLKARLNVDIPAQKLLGVCNPGLAHAAVSARAEVGAFLPCGLSLRAGPGQSETYVDLQNPGMISELFDEPGLVAPAQAAAEGLTRTLESIGTRL